MEMLTRDNEKIWAAWMCESRRVVSGLWMKRSVGSGGEFNNVS